MRRIGRRGGAGVVGAECGKQGQESDVEKLHGGITACSRQWEQGTYQIVHESMPPPRVHTLEQGSTKV